MQESTNASNLNRQGHSSIHSENYMPTINQVGNHLLGNNSPDKKDKQLNKIFNGSDEWTD